MAASISMVLNLGSGSKQLCCVAYPSGTNKGDTRPKYGCHILQVHSAMWLDGFGS